MRCPSGCRVTRRAISLLVVGLAALLPRPVMAQVFTKLTSVTAPGNPVVLDPGADVNSYTGASWVDFDDDGWPDLFVNRRGLYRNLGSGQFERYVGGPSGAPRSIGNSWADIDNDGDMDVLVTGSVAINPAGAGTYLFRNDGGVFVKDFRGSMADSLGNAGWGCAFGDYDLDGHIDAVIASANGFTGTSPNRLLHNLGDGGFAWDNSTDVTTGVDAYTIPTWADFDLDGDPDLSIGAGPVNGSFDVDYLYRNLSREGGTPLLSRLLLAPPATDTRDGQVWNWVDIDNDGDLDLFITNYGAFSPLVNDLYRNNAGSYVKQTEAQAGAIVTEPTRSLASIWGDFDNDGDLDAVVTNDAGTGNRYYRNDGTGIFASVAIGTLTNEAGPHYGICAADYDKDGDLDLFVVGTATKKGLYRNDLAAGSHWIELTLQGIQSNRAAIGARVRVLAIIGGVPRWQQREVSAQNSFNGHNDLTLHFGLGDATVLDSLVIDWPSGLHEEAAALPIDECRPVAEGSFNSTALAALFEFTGAELVGGQVHLAWRAAAGSARGVTVERAELAPGASNQANDDPSLPDPGWSAVAVLTVPDDGWVRFEDASVRPGYQYGYRLSWQEGWHQETGEAHWIVVPHPGLSMAIRGEMPL
ncbi:MAG: ASPIC/UnbV domain-containing protein, partial [bacterium]